MITCRELADFLMAYLDGELPVAAAASFEAHLAACPSCVRYMESYRRTIELERLARQDVAAMPEELVRAILAARARAPGT
jgi:anti-sigma factor RsiW